MVQVMEALVAHSTIKPAFKQVVIQDHRFSQSPPYDPSSLNQEQKLSHSWLGVESDLQYAFREDNVLVIDEQHFPGVSIFEQIYLTDKV